MRKKYKYKEIEVEAEPFQLGMEDGWWDRKDYKQYKKKENKNCVPFVFIKEYTWKRAFIDKKAFIVYHRDFRFVLDYKWFLDTYTEVKE